MNLTALRITRPSPALVVATLALIIAMATVVGHALLVAEVGEAHEHAVDFVAVFAK